MMLRVPAETQLVGERTNGPGQSENPAAHGTVLIP
jgi:hypothetical protein